MALDKEYLKEILFFNKLIWDWICNQNSGMYLILSQK